MSTASALSFARQALNRDKPHSSITDWIDILTGPNIGSEAYDGIPELVDSINLQPAAGPTEASRAIRKKLKHGNSHQQYRGMVILKALVENCGDKFKSSFADGQLTDAIKHLANNSDGLVDKKVQRKTQLVLQSWHEQYNGVPSMSVVANLYKPGKPVVSHRPTASTTGIGISDSGAQRRREQDEAKAKARAEKDAAKERSRKEQEERRRRKKNGPRRATFNFEQEKPKVLATIVDASQASNNLANAITLVNLQHERLQDNIRVQECLIKAKQVRKPIVRYIQLVENEELIGTLIEQNDRVISALELYDKMCTVDPTREDPEAALSSGLAAAHIEPPSESEVGRLQGKQRAAVQRAKSYAAQDDNVHPDLQDLNFGSIANSSTNLPPPIRPSNFSDDEDNLNDNRGTLSDFSDYESSDEETHQARGATGRKSYVTVSDDSDDDAARGLRKAADNDPFADPFADEVAVGPSHR